MEWIGQLSETEIIFIVLAAFYVLECVYWVGRHAVCFSPIVWKTHPRRASGFITHDHKGIVFALSPPYANVFICEQWPLCISPEGICPANSLGTAGTLQGYSASDYIAFEDIRSIECSGHKLLINGQHVAHFTLESNAQVFKKILVDISETSPALRSEVIEASLRASTDVTQIRQRFDDLKEKTEILRVYSSVLFFYLFCIGPALYYLAEGNGIYLLKVYLLGFLIYWLETIVTFYTGHRRLYPDRMRERRKQAVMMILSPVAAMRAPATISQSLLTTFQSFSVASVLCTPHTFSVFAHPIIRELRYSFPSAAQSYDLPNLRIMAWFYGRLDLLFCNILRDTGFDPSDFLKRPTPDLDAKSYCPRCHAQFVFAQGDCKFCEELPVQSFADDPGNGES